ncbi:MAG: hypothetical protein ABL986_23405 [Vicinamibacterales bacterium]
MTLLTVGFEMFEITSEPVATDRVAEPRTRRATERPRYTIDSRVVTEEEFQRRWEAAQETTLRHWAS